MQKLSDAIVAEAGRLPEGTPLAAKALLHLGSRMAIDQALSRLVRRGQLVRAGRGLYVRMVETRFGTRAPAVDVLVEGAARARGELVASHGAAAANVLGLTTQVPVRLVYLTSGPSREIQVGGLRVELRHAPRWQFTLAGHPAGDAVRALAWLGPERAGEVMETLKRTLPANVQAELVSARGQLPTWMAVQVSTLVDHARGLS